MAVKLCFDILIAFSYIHQNRNRTQYFKMHMYDFPKSFSDAAVPARILQVALKVFAQPFPVGLTP